MTIQLVRIKLIYQHGCNLSSKHDDVNLMLAVQTLDFAVETLLKYIIVTFEPHHNLDHKKFDELLNMANQIVIDKTSSKITRQSDFRKLRKIRNNAQHFSIIPNPRDITYFIPILDNFLITICQDLFHVDYETISALSLIQDDVLQNILQEAHNALNNEDWMIASVKATLAFEELINLARKIMFSDTEKQVSLDYEGIWATLQRSKSPIDRDIKQILSSFNQQLFVISENQIIATLGINFIDYIWFKHNSPHIYRTFGSTESKYSPNDPNAYTEEITRKLVSYAETQVLEFQSSGLYREIIE